MRRARLRRVRLDYGVAPYRAVAGKVFLATGVVCMALALYLSQHFYATRQALVAERADLQQPPAGRVARPALNKGEALVRQRELAAVNAVVEALLLPWEPMFAALEGMDMPQIKVLAVEPDAQRRKLRLTAQAGNPEAMLEYVRALDRQPMLDDALLLSHEQYRDGRAVAVRFVVEATWTP